MIPDAGHNPETETADREWRDFAHDKVKEFADTLTGKEREVFHARLLAEEPETLQQIGARFGISRERVRQIENAAQATAEGVHRGVGPRRLPLVTIPYLPRWR